MLARVELGDVCDLAHRPVVPGRLGTREPTFVDAGVRCVQVGRGGQQRVKSQGDHAIVCSAIKTSSNVMLFLAAYNRSIEGIVTTAALVGTRKLPFQCCPTAWVLCWTLAKTTPTRTRLARLRAWKISSYPLDYPAHFAKCSVHQAF